MKNYLVSESSVHVPDVEKWIDEELEKVGIDPKSIQAEENQEHKK